MASPHNTHGATCSSQHTTNTHIFPRRRVLPYRRKRRVFSLSLAALPSDLGKGEDMLSPSCPRRPAGQNVGLPWSQRVAWESPRGRRASRRLFGRASGPRARAVSSSFARRPSVSKQQHRGRARKAWHRKIRRQRRENGNYQATSGHITHAFISGEFSGLVRF